MRRIADVANTSTTPESDDHDEHQLVIFSCSNGPHEVGELLKEELRIHPTAVTNWSHHIPGILNESFGRKQACELEAAIRGLGAHVRVIRRDQIPDLRRPVPILDARCEPTVLEVTDAQHAAEIMIPWAAVEMLCVGDVAIDDGHCCTGYDEPANTKGVDISENDRHQSTTHRLELLISCKAPYPHLRAHHHRRKHEYLGLRRAAWSRIDFRRFLNDLIQHATSAMITESTRDFLKHKRHGKQFFKTLDEFISYATFHALLAREAKS
jgi:hypothetical protein